jgi:hypothetical protein
MRIVMTKLLLHYLEHLDYQMYVVNIHLIKEKVDNGCLAKDIIKLFNDVYAIKISATLVSRIKNGHLTPMC